MLFPLLTMSRSCAAFDWATGHEKLTELTGDWPPLECMLLNAVGVGGTVPM